MRASASGATPLTRRPGHGHVAPASGTSWPLATFRVVVLPAPLGPSSATTRAGGHGQVDAVEHLDAAVADADVPQLEDVLASPSAPPQAAPAAFPR